MTLLSKVSYTFTIAKQVVLVFKSLSLSFYMRLRYLACDTYNPLQMIAFILGRIALIFQNL